ncbi:MAG TPA: hypothetical protein VGF85_03420 [Opitutaceae bacterium]|jgi:hypothetical protein
MELNLQPRAASCAVTGRAFQEGDRVTSVLVRKDNGEVARYDAFEASAGELNPDGFVACRWVQLFKPQSKLENPDRALKLTAETLFLTLADPSTTETPETARLVRFLALMLERKKLLRPKGRSPDGAREIYEHARTKQLYEVLAIDLGPEFFTAVREQLTVLVGEPKPPQPAAAEAAPAGP